MNPRGLCLRFLISPVYLGMMMTIYAHPLDIKIWCHFQEVTHYSFTGLHMNPVWYRKNKTFICFISCFCFKMSPFDPHYTTGNMRLFIWGFILKPGLGNGYFSKPSINRQSIMLQWQYNAIQSTIRHSTENNYTIHVHVYIVTGS